MFFLGANCKSKTEMDEFRTALSLHFPLCVHGQGWFPSLATTRSRPDPVERVTLAWLQVEAKGAICVCLQSLSPHWQFVLFVCFLIIFVVHYAFFYLALHNLSFHFWLWLWKIQRCIFTNGVIFFHGHRMWKLYTLWSWMPFGIHWTRHNHRTAHSQWANLVFICVCSLKVGIRLGFF